MRRHLVFELYAPIASMSTQAGKRRLTDLRPARSALLGLVGAALGLDRLDAAGQEALQEDIGLVSAVIARGQVFNDFHTIQTVSESGLRAFRKVIGDKSWNPRTRRDELQCIDANIVTNREYVTDVLVRVALWLRNEGNFSLEKIAAALRSPAYPLYLGRKSCTLGLPVQAEMVIASSAVKAMASHPDPAGFRQEILAAAGVRSAVAAGDGDGFDDSGPVNVERRGDAPGSRAAWSFRPRLETVASFRPNDCGMF